MLQAVDPPPSGSYRVIMSDQPLPHGARWCYLPDLDVVVVGRLPDADPMPSA